MLLPNNTNKKDQLFAQFLDDSAKVNYDDLKIDVMTCDTSLLPHIALSIGANIDYMEELESRKYLSVFQKKSLGTIGAVEDVANVYFKNVKVVEWFEDSTLEKGMFRLDIRLDKNSSFKYGDKRFSTSTRVINKNKNVRSKLDSYKLSLVADGNIQIAGGGVSATKLVNDLEIDYKADGNIDIAGGGVSHSQISNILVLDSKSNGNIDFFTTGVSQQQISNELILDSQSNGNIDIAGGGVSDIKLKNEVVVFYPTADTKNYGGGVGEINMKKEFKNTPLLGEIINITGAGLWTI